jgi:hypothetical protein
VPCPWGDEPTPTGGARILPEPALIRTRRTNGCSMRAAGSTGVRRGRDPAKIARTTRVTAIATATSTSAETIATISSIEKPPSSTPDRKAAE